MIDKPGVYQISEEDYHSDKVCPEPCLSRSIIKDLLFNAPAKAWWNNPRLNPDFRPDYGEGKFDKGSAAHSMLLQGIDNVAVIDAEDWRKKETKEAREIARLEGKVPMLKYQYQEALAMVKAAEKQILLCKDLGITNMRDQGDSELTYIWQEEGVWLKVRLDWISKSKNLVIDYKTTKTSANPADVSRLIASLHYDLQQAFYVRGVKAIEGTEPRFIFIIQEVEEPYLCSFVELPEMMKITGEQKVMNGVFLWKECLSTGNWYGYPQRVVTIDPVRWAINDWEQRSLTIGLNDEERP